MAKTNKFASLNLNHIYDKNLSSSPNRNPTKNPSSSSSTPFSYSAVSAPKPYGRMLVLTKPKPKPKPDPTPPSPQPTPQLPPPQIRSEPDAISLRPLGSTGSGSAVSPPVLSQGRDKQATVLASSPKPDKFVPPHLRSGFVAKEERPGPDVIRPREPGHKHFGPRGRFWEDGRPKSGGDSNMNRPRSSGWNRPNSSGW